MRYVIGVVLALSVGIGAYLGSAQVADSAKTPPRKVTLRIGDVAAFAFGHVQCQANAPSRARTGHTPGPNDVHLHCSSGRAAESVDVSLGGVRVSKEAGHIQCFLGGPGSRASIFVADLICDKYKGREKHIHLSVEVLPGGIAVRNDDGKRVYKTGWHTGW